MPQFTITELSRDKSYGSASRPQISGEKVVWRHYKKGNKDKILLHDGNKTIEISGGLYPKIAGDNIVWSDFDSEGNTQIFLNNGKETIQLSKNEYASKILSLEISGDNLVWCTNYNSLIRETYWFDVNPVLDKGYFYGEISLHNGKEIIVLTDNSVGSSPQVSGDSVVWQGIVSSFNDDEDSEIFFYNGKKTIQLTDNDVFDYSPQISGDNVVWISGISEQDLFLYNGKETIQINDQNVKSSNPQIYGNNVVWEGVGSNGNSEIFFYNGKETIQLTDNDVYDYSPQISGDNVVWISGDGSGILLYNGSETIQLTDNDEFFETSPKIDGNKIVWQRYNLAEHTTSIMLATIDDTESSSTPPLDREQKFVSSSMIILGLISICLLKKLCLK